MAGTQIQLPERLDVKEWGLSTGFSREKVEKYLQTNQIQYEEIYQHNGITPYLAISPSGVVIHFSEDDIIWSISVSQK